MMSKNQTILKIPLFRRTKNHLGVMYFGALAMGGEAAIGLNAAMAIRKSGRRVDFLFKDFQADFKKRADGDVYFICDQGLEVQQFIQKAIDTGERQNQTFQSYALVPGKNAEEKVATFSVTLTAKLRA